MRASVVFFALCGLAVALANESTCGSGKPAVSGCEHTDLGSCGNACCVIDAFVPVAPEVAYTTIKNYLSAGGSDKSFTFSSGPDAAGHNPSDDLRQYNISYAFVFQGTHSTTSGYIDTLNFNVQSSTTKTGSSVVRGFSTSNIHGALGDGGQNYKTFDYMFSKAFSQSAIDIVYGCGAKSEFWQ